MKKRLLLIFLLIAALTSQSNAEKRETALWSYVSISKPINERWSASAQTELRTGDDNTRLYLRLHLSGYAQQLENQCFECRLPHQVVAEFTLEHIFISHHDS